MTQQVAPEQDGGAPVRGLRERKKQRTRQELVEAAIRLFLAQGYEHTTVDQIAAAVDVSQRTFFRYFANKEEAAFGAMTEAEGMFHECLRRRPADETPFVALRGAMRDVWRRLGDEGGRAVDTRLHLQMVRLIESTPALLAAHLRRTEALEERLAVELGRRAGVDPDEDPRPRLLTAVFGAVARVANRTWTAHDETELDAMIGVMERYLDHLGPALTESWGELPGGS